MPEGIVMFARKFSFGINGGRPIVSEHGGRSPRLGSHPANLETTLHRRARKPFAARVRDISRGGVNLVADRAFQPVIT